MKVLLVFLLFSVNINGQQTYFKKGDFQLGTKWSQNLLQDKNFEGFGIGFHAQYFLSSSVCTELNIEYSNIDLGEVGASTSTQYGLSFFYFLSKEKKFKPYFIAGYNYNMIQITPASFIYVDRTDDILNGSQSRVNFGLGGNYQIINNKLNLGLDLQYELPLNDQPRFDLESVGSGFYLNTKLAENHEVTPIHYLKIRFSLNYRITNFLN